MLQTYLYLLVLLRKAVWWDSFGVQLKCGQCHSQSTPPSFFCPFFLRLHLPLSRIRLQRQSERERVGLLFIGAAGEGESCCCDCLSVAAFFFPCALTPSLFLSVHLSYFSLSLSLSCWQQMIDRNWRVEVDLCRLTWEGFWWVGWNRGE